jgi:hypothetical protein
MASDLRALYWPGAFRGLYQQLQAANAASAARVSELLAARQDWLLHGPARFGAPSDTSRRAARDALKAGKLVLSAPGDGKGGQRVTLDGRLEQATLEMSAILVRRAPGGGGGGGRPAVVLWGRQEGGRPRAVAAAAATAAVETAAAAAAAAAAGLTSAAAAAAARLCHLDPTPPPPTTPSQDLDEVQTILLLRRFAADTGATLVAAGAPAGEQASLDPATVVEVGRGAGCSRRSRRAGAAAVTCHSQAHRSWSRRRRRRRAPGRAAAAPSILPCPPCLPPQPSPPPPKVIEYYFSERLYLLKCLQFLAIAGEGVVPGRGPAARCLRGARQLRRRRRPPGSQPACHCVLGRGPASCARCEQLTPALPAPCRPARSRV